ncbi:rCG30101 [Rattus norvegicus]|uniref:RCG30101 n=1 Tax=Rattus norvegicus TaxID=10116 RepID=A6ILT7_RAT|nr:rCG30101 [Rattus norvegicus]
MAVGSKTSPIVVFWTSVGPCIPAIPQCSPVPTKSRRSHGHEEVGPRGTGALHAVLWTSGRLPKCLEPQEPLTPGTERQELLSAAILLHAELWSCFGLIIPCYVPVPPREVEYSLCAIVYRKLITFFFFSFFFFFGAGDQTQGLALARQALYH